MLRTELKDSDIPHRTTIREQILEVWEDHLKDLGDAMRVCYSSLIMSSGSDAYS